MLNEQEIREKNLNIIKQEIKKSQYMASILFLNATDTLILINYLNIQTYHQIKILSIKLMN